MTKHVYFTKLMYFLKLWTKKCFKRNIFCWDKMFSHLQLSGAPSSGIFELMGSSQLGVSEGYSVTTLSHVLCCFVQRNRWIPQKRRERCKSFILWKQIRSDWGFPGCLVLGSPFAFLVLSPLWHFFFFLMCLLGWLETEVKVGGRMIELGQFSFCCEVNTSIDTADSFASYFPCLLHSLV